MLLNFWRKCLSLQLASTMKLTLNEQYKKLSDQELVEKIITAPFDDEAAMYLIYDRYEPLCISVCLKTLGSVDRLDELQSELFIHLKGKTLDWHALRAFQWRSTLGRWLGITAYNLSLSLRNTLIENKGQNLSIDDGWENEDGTVRQMEIAHDDELELQHRYRMLLLREAISQLENPDQRFVVTLRLQGYSSKEVAIMLDEHWHQSGTVHYNKQHQPVIPDSGYIDNLFKRGYERTKHNYQLLDK